MSAEQWCKGAIITDSHLDFTGISADQLLKMLLHDICHARATGISAQCVV